MGLPNPISWLQDTFNRGTPGNAKYVRQPPKPPAAPTVVPSSGINRGVQIPGFVNTHGDDASITKARHANADFYAQVNKRLQELNQPQLPPMPGGGGGGSSASSSLLASLGLKAAASPYDRAIGQLGVDYKNNRGQAITQGQRQDADLAELFSRLGNYTQGVMDTGRRDFIGTGKSLAKNYDALGQNIAGTYKTGVGNTNAELQRLGIQQVAPSALAGLGKDALYLGNQTKIDKSNAIGNNNANADVFKSLMREMIGSAAVEGTSQRGRAKQATADALNALMQQYAKDKTELSGKKADALLQARMANLKAAASRSSGGGGSNSLANWLWKEKYKESKGIGSYGKDDAHKPSGFNDAMTLLAKEAGNDPQKLKDLRGELDFLASDRFGQKETPYEHLINSWGQRGKYGNTSIDALMSALAALNKKY